MGLQHKQQMICTERFIQNNTKAQMEPIAKLDSQEHEAKSRLSISSQRCPSKIRCLGKI